MAQKILLSSDSIITLEKGWWLKNSNATGVQILLSFYVPSVLVGGQGLFHGAAAAHDRFLPNASRALKIYFQSIITSFVN